MNDPNELSERQRRVIPHLLAARSIEECCRSAKVGKATVYGWLQDETFQKEFRRQRNLVINSALDTLKGNIVKATETLVRHLESDHENISIRAAERIIEFTQKALEYDELDKRIAALEATVPAKRAR